jgi:hypothetical protein
MLLNTKRINDIGELNCGTGCNTSGLREQLREGVKFAVKSVTQVSWDTTSACNTSPTRLTVRY